MTGVPQGLLASAPTLPPVTETPSSQDHPSIHPPRSRETQPSTSCVTSQPTGTHPEPTQTSIRNHQRAAAHLAAPAGEIIDPQRGDLTDLGGGQGPHQAHQGRTARRRPTVPASRAPARPARATRPAGIPTVAAATEVGRRLVLQYRTARPGRTRRVARPRGAGGLHRRSQLQRGRARHHRCRSRGFARLGWQLARGTLRVRAALPGGSHNAGEHALLDGVPG